MENKLSEYFLNAVACDYNNEQREEARAIVMSEGIEHIDEAQALAIFESCCQRELGITAEEFLRRWDAGEYANAHVPNENRRLMRVQMLMPLLRRG